VEQVSEAYCEGNIIPDTMQSLTVSHELIRVAMLWHELWHEYLEEASRLFFTEKNADAMITHLESLHQLMEKVDWYYSGHFFDNNFSRVQRQVAKLLSYKSMGRICEKLATHVCDIAVIVTTQKWTKHGKRTMGYE
jgi:phosphatidylinositol kinase/protein kinase (PI-3  family)